MQKPRQIHIPHTFILILSTHIPYTRGMQKPMHMHIPYTSKYILYTHINTLYTHTLYTYSIKTYIHTLYTHTLYIHTYSIHTYPGLPALLLPHPPDKQTNGKNHEQKGRHDGVLYLFSVKRDLISVKRDLISVKREDQTLLAKDRVQEVLSNLNYYH